MRSKMRVGVVFGGKSVEHEVSIVSARSVMNAMDRKRFEVIPIGVTKDGRWLSTDDSMKLLNGEVIGAEVRNSMSIGSDEFKRRFDVVFPMIHGAYGEDGKLQGMLELADIPYVGAGPLSSALGMDKDFMKRLFTLNGIPVPAYRGVSWHEWGAGKDGISRSIYESLGLPLFVKPANTGSSVGIGKVKNGADLINAIDEAFRYDNKVIVERGINAREIECSVLGNADAKASIPGEVIPCNEFYDYRAKYIDERSKLLIPAPLDSSQVKIVQELAVRAFKTLECSGMARVDFFLEKETGVFYVNELNTIPGFTPISMYPKLWEASGLSYSDLITRLIELAMERHTLNARLQTSYSTDSI